MGNIITLEEKRNIYLDMLREVDAFCRQNNIRYSLAYGSLLGAVRHGGFIPWDDDLDITMPLPDMIRFKNEFKSDKIEFRFIDNDTDYELSFPRLVHRQTYCDIGLFNRGMGISIDLYVVVGLPEDKKNYLDRAMMLSQRKSKLTRFSHLVAKCTPLRSLFLFRKSVRSYLNHIYTEVGDYETAKDFYSIGTSIRKEKLEKSIFHFDLFDALIDINFENMKCLATVYAHEYLAQIYGDYMKLPPLDKRKPRHIANYHWK